MDRERLDRLCEAGMLGTLLGLLVFTPLALGGVRPTELAFVQWGAAALLALWAVRLWTQESARLWWPPVCWAVVIFTGYALFAWRAADVEYVARQEILRVVVYAAVFLAVINNLHRKEHVRWIVATLILTGLVVAGHGLWQVATGTEKVWHFIRAAFYGSRASGTFICPNHLAGYLEMIVPVAVAFTFAGKFSHVARVLIGYAAVVMVLAVGLSQSRGGWIAGILGLGLCLLCLARERRYRIAAAGVVLVTVVAAGVFVANSRTMQHRLHDLFLNDRDSDNRGHLIWPAAAQMWREHPWTGVGPGHFDLRYRQYRLWNSSAQARPDRVHNDYLNALADWGVVGSVIITGAFLLLLRGVLDGWPRLRRQTNEGGKQGGRFAFVLGAGSGLVALMLHSFVDFNWHIPSNALTAVLLMALLASHLRYVTDRWWATPGVLWRVALTGLFALGAVWIAESGWRQRREHQLLQRVAEMHTATPERLALLREAWAVEPRNFETAYLIGEHFRLLSWEGLEGHKEQAREAIEWFERAAALNPWSPHARLRHGMCLDWLGRHAEAEALFYEALQVDPNSYFTLAHMGWHYFQKGQYAAAKQWLMFSYRLRWFDNPVALDYLGLINAKFQRGETGPR